MQPDEAVREYAFAFAPDSLTLPLLPPPGCPPLASLPTDIQQMFLRAFLRGAERPGHRATAKEWTEGLERLSKSLITCGRQPQHIFWRQAASCPWCAVIQETGVDVFPTPLGHVAAGGTATSRSDDQIGRLRVLRPYQFEVQQPAVFTNIVAEPIPPEPTDFWSGVIRFFSHRGWKRHWLDPSLKKFRQQLNEAEDVVRRSLFDQQEAISKYRNEFARAQPQLQSIVAKLTNQARIRQEIATSVGSQRQQLELNEFLQRCKIRHADIPDIGPGRKATLQSYGIETAADLSPRTLAGVRGFGPALQSRMLNWKQSHAARFHFNPHQAPSQVVQVEIERRFQEEVRRLKEEAAKIEAVLNSAQGTCSDCLRSCIARANQAARVREQAKANITAFEAELR